MKDPFTLDRFKFLPNEIGIYFLFKKGELIYIGQSRAMPSRLISHRRYIDWDEYSFIECEEHELRKLEKQYIIEYQPKLNFIPRAHRRKRVRNVKRKRA